MAKKKVGTKATNKKIKGSYAPIKGLNLYYEIHGKGEPLILLHGGVVPAKCSIPFFLHSPKPGKSSRLIYKLMGEPPTSSGRLA